MKQNVVYMNRRGELNLYIISYLFCFQNHTDIKDILRKTLHVGYLETCCQKSRHKYCVVLWVDFKFFILHKQN